MNVTELKTLWRDVENDTNAAHYLLQHADCNGALAHLPTHDPAVRTILRARRHLLTRARRTRERIAMGN